MTSVVEHPLSETCVTVANYQCFGPEQQGFDRLLPFNVIIGRNNVGKSSLLDLIEYAVDPRNESGRLLGSRQSQVSVMLSTQVIASDAARVFQSHNSDSLIGNYYEFGQNLIGRRISWKLLAGGSRELDKIDLTGLPRPSPNLLKALLDGMQDPFHGLRFRRLSAERDVRPENEGKFGQVSESGVGATSAVQVFLTRADLDRSLVEDKILADLNTIFRGDTVFSRLLPQRADQKSSEWEIYVQEKGKSLVPLSRSGSGVKTVILVLVFLHLLPRMEGRTAASYIYGFEELENHLHPALQRRLLMFLKETADREGCRFILTTHSNVAIDYFVRDELAQVIHVTQNQNQIRVASISGYAGHRMILDDLDIRASDILQSNGVIWVEGPSDRIYVNKWIELWSKSKYREGAHYQCVFYGGSTYKYLSGTSPDHAAPQMKILTLNRNSALLMDSDRKNQTDQLSEKQLRICAEVETSGGFTWVTSAREVENFIPAEILIGEGVQPSPGPSDDVPSRIAELRRKGKTNLSADKVKLANRIAPALQRKHLEENPELAKNVDRLCGEISKWNGGL